MKHKNVVSIFVTLLLIAFFVIACGGAGGGGSSDFEIHSYRLPDAPHSVAIGDLNSDGRNDVALLARGEGASFFSNNLYTFIQGPTGEFESLYVYSGVSGDEGYIKLGDMNSDGKIDVVVSAGNDFGIFYQNSSGYMDSIVKTTETRYHYDYNDISIADLNGDGLTDVATVLPREIRIYYQDIAGNFTSKVSIPLGGFEHAAGMDVGDLDNNGLTDVILARPGSAQGNSCQLRIFFQQIDSTLGTYQCLSLPYPLSYVIDVSVGDVNFDGRDDVLASFSGGSSGSTNIIGGITTYIQDESGQLLFSATAETSIVGYPLATGDLDGKGGIDTATFGFVSFVGGFINVTRLTVNGESSNPSSRYGVTFNSISNKDAIAIGDVNGDKLNDIVFAYWPQDSLQGVHFFINRGDWK